VGREDEGTLNKRGPVMEEREALVAAGATKKKATKKKAAKKKATKKKATKKKATKKKGTKKMGSASWRAM
jgi:hypothetical protein